MGDRTVTFRPVDGRSYDIVGSETDAGVLLSIADHDGRYAEEVSALLLARVPADGVILDVGANIGVLTVLAADLADNGRVVAFEPGAENLRYLRLNVAGRTNVEIVEAAVSASDGTLRFDDNPDYPAGAHIAAAGGVEVACRSIDSWAEEHSLPRLDVLKIDVEGAEPAVLDGAVRTIARFHPLVVAECNVASLRRVSSTSFSALRAQLATMVHTVGILRPGGEIIPLESDEHLELTLAAEGVVDLVGYEDRRRIGPAIKARQHLRRLRAAAASATPPDLHNFVITAPVGLSLEPGATLAGAAGTERSLRVHVENRSRWWLSPDFVYHPVNIGARWVGGPEAGRATFDSPVPPGGSADVDLDVVLPNSVGTHTLEISLVQEHFAWVVDLDPRCSLRVDFEVAASDGGTS